MTKTKPTRTEILSEGRIKAIDRNRDRSSQAQRRVEAAITEMERTGRQLTNTAIHTLADVHENWLYEHADVKAHADRVRAQIRRDKITAAAAGQTELAEQLKTENAQLLARNRMLANQLHVVQHALAQARADEVDGTVSSAELDRIGTLQDRISELEAASHKLTLERNTAVIEARRLQRDLSATQGALADAERRGLVHAGLGNSTSIQ
jgi:hypothetical protein